MKGRGAAGERGVVADGPLLGDEFQKRVQRPGVGDVRRLAPPPPGLVDAVAHVVELRDAMGIGADHQLHARVASHLTVDVVQVEPVGCAFTSRSTP